MTTPPADLDLATRPGLPPTIAYLRAAHPQPGWRAHANYGELTDFWLAIHAQLRHHGAEVTATTDAFRDRRIDAASFGQALVPRLNRFLGHLDGHHRIEDHAYFPKFRALDPRMVVGFDLMESDHGLIHAAIEATVASARTLLATVAGASGDPRRATDAFAAQAGSLLALLHRHLADEEELVVPALLEHGERPIT